MKETATAALAATDPRPGAVHANGDAGRAQHVRKQKQVVRQGDNYLLHTPVEYTSTLAPGNYILNFDEMNGRFYLTTADAFEFPSKVYGNPHALVDRYLHTMRSRRKSTGVLLCGHKGSGKTLTAQLLCSRSNIPVVMVNRPYTGNAFQEFINDIPGDVVVFFDEFEKVYSKDHQAGLLSLLDGNYQARRLFLMTSNTEDVSFWLRNRPGRIFYKRSYHTLDADVVREYVADNLKDPKEAAGLMRVLAVLDNCSMDTLCSIVEEMNRFGEPADVCAKHMNVEIEGAHYDYTVKLNGVEAVKIYNNPHPLTHETSFHVDYYLYPDGRPFPGATSWNSGLPDRHKEGGPKYTNFMFACSFKAEDYTFDAETGVYSLKRTVDADWPGIRYGGERPADGFKIELELVATKLAKSGWSMF